MQQKAKARRKSLSKIAGKQPPLLKLETEIFKLLAELKPVVDLEGVRRADYYLSR
jgi:hypothetical protein